jgi:hypothetical protein
MFPDSSAKALKELDYFMHDANLGANLYLVDSMTGDELYAYVEGYDGIIVYDGRSGFNAGFNHKGFFIVTRDTQQTVFKSMRFEQWLIEPEKTEAHEDGQVIFVDVDTQANSTCSFAISGHQIAWQDGRLENDKGKIRCSYPRALHVQERNTTPQDFDYILQPLTRIFRAAVETGNPVRWC